MQTQSETFKKFTQYLKSKNINVDTQISEGRVTSKAEFQKFCMMKIIDKNKFKDNVQGGQMLKAIIFANSVTKISSQYWLMGEQKLGSFQRYINRTHVHHNSQSMNLIWMFLLQNLQSAGCKSFLLQFYSNVVTPGKLVKAVQSINFPYLQTLKLNIKSNNISLQFVSFLNAPMLEKIQIFSNCEINTRFLNKTNFPFLNNLEFTAKIDHSYEELSRISMSRKTELQIDFQDQTEDRQRAILKFQKPFIFKLMAKSHCWDSVKHFFTNFIDQELLDNWDQEQIYQDEEQFIRLFRRLYGKFIKKTNQETSEDEQIDQGDQTD